MAEAPMKLQAKFGSWAKRGGSRNLESLGCANREKKKFLEEELFLLLKSEWICKGLMWWGDSFK